MAGTVYRMKDRVGNPWRAAYRGPDGKQRSKTFARKSDAEKWLTAELAELNRGTWVDPAAGKIKLADWSRQWLASIDVKPKTRAGYESMLNARIHPTFEHTQLRRITPAAVREWLVAMSDEGLSPATVAAARRVLHACLQRAVDDGVLGRNPVDRKVKAPKVRPRRQLFLTAEQLAALANAADRHQKGMGALILVLGWSGIRWGEAVTLRRSCVDVDRRRIHVREAATEVHGKLVFGTPKSHEERTVIVPRFVVESLHERLEQIDADDLVFTSPKGAPLRNGNFRRGVWRAAIKASGAPTDLVPHDLRDTAASLMISAGASVVAVARALGHADPSLTLRVYAGLYEDDLEELADRLEARYGASGDAHDPETGIETDSSGDSGDAQLTHTDEIEADEPEAESL